MPQIIREIKKAKKKQLHKENKLNRKYLVEEHNRNYELNKNMKAAEVFESASEETSVSVDPQQKRNDVEQTSTKESFV